MRLSRCAASVLALAMITTAATAGLNRWTTNGPEGGFVTAFAFDPVNSSTLYAGTYRGVFKTINGGQTWRETGQVTTTLEDAVLDLSISSLAIAPSAPSTIFAGTNAGELLKSTDSGGTWTILPGAFRHRGAVLAVLADPMSSTLYLATSTGVFRSSDAGASWNEWSQLPGGFGNIVLLAMSPSKPVELYMGTVTGLFRSDGVTDWRRTAFPGLRIGFVAIDPGSAQHIFASSFDTYGRTLFFSTKDAGATWAAEPQPIRRLVFAPQTRGTAYAVSDNGLLRTTDGGSTWVVASITQPVSMIAISPTDSATLYGTGWGLGISRTNDGGSTWTTVNSGLTAAFATEVEVAPSDRSVLYTVTNQGVFKSSDSGNHWSLSKDGYASGVSIDPHTPARVFAGNARTTDGGESWTRIDPGTEPHYAVDPSKTATVYAAAADRIARSDDGGTTWYSLGTGQLPLGYYGVFEGSSIAVDPSTTSTVYATGAGSIVKSVDAGKNWRTLYTGTDIFYPNDSIWAASGLQIDPIEPSTIYAAANFPNGGAVARSTDGGQSWTVLRNGIPLKSYVADVAIDPRDPSILYAATSVGVFRSTDQGENWSEFDTGLPVLEVSGLTIDSTGKTLYAATAAGVFSYTTEGALPPGVSITRLPDDPARLPRLVAELTRSTPFVKANAAFLLAAAANTAGANATYFRSDVTLANWTTRPQDLMVVWLEQGKDGTNAPAFRLTLPALSQAGPRHAGIAAFTISDFVGRLGFVGLGSLLFLATDSNGSIDGTASMDGSSRVWSRQPGSAGTVSQTFPLLRFDRSPNTDAFAVGLRQDSAFRTNLGIVNLDSRPTDFDVDVIRQGEQVSTFTMSLAPFSMTQIAVPGPGSGAMSLALTSSRRDNFWAAYGASIDQVTGDGWVAPATPIPSATFADARSGGH